MRYLHLFPLVVVILLPFCEAIFLIGTGTTTAAATTLTLGTGGAGAAAILGLGAAAVVGGLALAALAGSRRGKRDTTPSCMPIDNPDFFLTLAANSDQLGCGLRLICELEATSDELLSQDEALILSLFGRAPTPPKQSELKASKSGFQYAALVGSLAKDVSECAQVFDECPWDRQTLMKLFTEGKNQI
ncbi:unnamed protein product [Meganyctiphanes norvegica]|uniref:Uncharacterized protein n=1 Tax=Meganyctiphanes norvegica TaxID=48144 RepID=A0AAV2QEV6_MEGNR